MVNASLGNATQAPNDSFQPTMDWSTAFVEGLMRVRLLEPAALTRVSTLGVEVQRLKVLIDFTDPPEHWRALDDSFRVGVRSVTLSADKAVKVSVRAMFPLPQGASNPRGGMAALRFEDGRARTTPVQVGARNGAASVRKGQAPGANVIVHPPSAVQDGARVKVRKL